MNKYNLSEYVGNIVVLDEKDRIVSFGSDEKVIESDVSRYLSYMANNLSFFKLIDDDIKKGIKAILD